MRSAVLVWMGLSMGCGASRGSILEQFVAPGGEYAFRYLDPPWNVTFESGTQIELEVPASHQDFLPPGALPPKLALVVTLETGEAEARARADEVAAAAVVHPVSALETRRGQVAWTIATLRSEDDRFLRAAYVNDPVGTSRVVRMLFDSDDDLENAEIDAMIGDLQVRPETR